MKIIIERAQDVHKRQIFSKDAIDVLRRFNLASEGEIILLEHEDEIGAAINLMEKQDSVTKVELTIKQLCK